MNNDEKIKIISNFLSAIPADRYQVLLKKDGKETSFVAWKDGKKSLYLTKDEVLENLAGLKARNTKGYEIFIKPFTSRNYFIVVNNVSLKSLDAMAASGFKPCVRTLLNPGENPSKHLQQVVLMIPKCDGEQDAFRVKYALDKLVRRYGEGSVSVQEPMVVPGFKIQGDYATLERSAPRLCTELAKGVDGFRKALVEAGMSLTAPNRREGQSEEEFERQEAIYKSQMHGDALDNEKISARIKFKNKFDKC